ncbi:hypothetical protein LB505_003571 [Fusarium chuoi]|nr:hypothetical protein LB505_003571 [Fusarium chuoi]
MGDVFLGFRPRSGDILIAIMGMTGSGKSTFISLCTGQDVPVHSTSLHTNANGQIPLTYISWTLRGSMIRIDQIPKFSKRLLYVLPRHMKTMSN